MLGMCAGAPGGLLMRLRWHANPIIVYGELRKASLRIAPLMIRYFRHFRLRHDIRYSQTGLPIRCVKIKMPPPHNLFSVFQQQLLLNPVLQHSLATCLLSYIGFCV